MALTISINQAAAFTVNVGVPGPTGATGPAGPQGPAGPAGAGGVWGSITGTLSNQTDLVSALAGKYSTTNPAGYIDLTTAGLYFYPLTGNPGGFATQAWVIGQNYLTIGSLDAYATMSWVNTELAGYALQSWVTDHAYPLTGNPSGFLTSASLSGYATESWVTSQGYITASALSPYLLSSTAASTYAVIARGLPASGTTGQVLSKVDGTDYNATWTTFTPGDRYLTTSTSAMSISNGAKTFTAGTGLSYTPTQDVTIAHDSANHMHGTVTSYNSGTGAMVVEVQNHSGSGTYSSWTINVGGAIPAASVIWGDITGTLGDQSDLATALNNKLEVSTAASTYYLQTNPSGFIGDAPSDGSQYARKNGAWDVVSGGGSYITSVTSPLAVTSGNLSVDLSAYLNLAGGLMTGTIFSVSGGSAYGSEVSSSLHRIYALADTSQFAEMDVDSLTVSNASGTTQVTTTGVVLSASGTITFGDATTQNTAGYPATNPSGFIGDAVADGSLYGRVNNVWSPVPPPGISDAPSDGQTYGRNSGSWSVTLTAPAYYNSVWVYGNWYSANITTLTDGYGNYYNGLTF